MGKYIRQPVCLATRKLIYKRDQGICQICGSSISFSEMTLDHIHPLAKGGDSQPDNLQCACQVCNSLKQDLTMSDFYGKIVEIYWFQVKKKCGNDFSRKLKRLLSE